MNYWMFVATYRKLPNGRWLDSREIIRTRAADKFWGLAEKTPNRKSIAAGDRLVWYAGGGDSQVFMGTATLASAAYKLTPEQQDALSHGRDEFRTEYGVDLEDVELWPILKPTRELVPRLDFVEYKEYWGGYFQGGIRSLSPTDYLVITEGDVSDLVQQVTRQTDLQSASEFALEQHLEEFIEMNWSNIDFGAPLALYEVEGQRGRQFPAGPPGSNWSIDFLAVDQTTRELVVIELKRGKTGDAVAGQVLRYMSWVRENLASDGQGVRGIVIAKAADDALRYALNGQPVHNKDLRSQVLAQGLASAGHAFSRRRRHRSAEQTAGV